MSESHEPPPVDDKALRMAVGILRAVDAGTLDQRSMAADAMYIWAAEHGGVEWLRKQDPGGQQTSTTPVTGTVSGQMVHAALDLYAAQIERWGMPTSAMRSVLEFYESARGAGGGWIACSERMPEVEAGGDREYGVSDRCLVWHPGMRHGPCTAFYWFAKRTWCDDESMGALPPHAQATHWRPLPPPPTNKAREEVK